MSVFCVKFSLRAQIVKKKERKELKSRSGSTWKPHWTKYIGNVLIKDNCEHFLLIFILGKIRINVYIESRFLILWLFFIFPRLLKRFYSFRKTCYKVEIMNDNESTDIYILRRNYTTFLLMNSFTNRSLYVICNNVNNKIFILW